MSSSSDSKKDQQLEVEDEELQVYSPISSQMDNEIEDHSQSQQLLGLNGEDDMGTHQQVLHTHDSLHDSRRHTRSPLKIQHITSLPHQMHSHHIQSNNSKDEESFGLSHIKDDEQDQHELHHVHDLRHHDHHNGIGVSVDSISEGDLHDHVAHFSDLHHHPGHSKNNQSMQGPLSMLPSFPILSLPSNGTLPNLLSNSSNPGSLMVGIGLNGINSMGMNHMQQPLRPFSAQQLHNMMHPSQSVLASNGVVMSSDQQLPLLVQNSPNEITQNSETGDADTDSDSKSNNYRKSRWRPSQDQRAILESVWRGNQYPDQKVKSQILRQLGTNVNYKQITSWFKHKRENDKAKGNFTYKFSPSQKFTSEQIEKLEESFQNDAYARGKSLSDLATMMNVNIKRVQNWFKHKRSRLAQQGRFNYKPRNLLNSEQITFLRGAFFTNSSPAPELCEELANELDVKPEQVTRWFSNERSRKRKREEHLKLDSDEEDSSSLSVIISTPVRPMDAQKKRSRKQKNNNSLIPNMANDVHQVEHMPSNNALLPLQEHSHHDENFLKESQNSLHQLHVDQMLH